MKTRKAASLDASDEEAPTKRRKTQEEQASHMSLMDSLNDDCLVNILSYLPSDDLISIAMCNRRLRDARSHESLDQTRTGIIIISEGTTATTLYSAIIDSNWTEAFSGNRTKLKFVGLERLSGYTNLIYDLSEDVAERAPQFTGVTSLDASYEYDPNAILDNYRDAYVASMLCRMFPNLRELDMSYVHLWGEVAKHFRHFPELTKITWSSNGSNPQSLSGNNFLGLSHLNELHLDGFWFAKDSSSLMFELCPTIERLSIKGCSWHHFYSGETTVLPQEKIIEMVRSQPSLRWLRSDLSEENVAMLQQERPDITFVSE